MRSQDHAISIAILHHFSTVDRRCEAIKQLINAVTPRKPSHPPTVSPSTSTSSPAGPSSREGTFIASVWSLEQDPSLVGVGSARRKTGPKKGAIPIAPELLPSSGNSAPSSNAEQLPERDEEPDGDENPRGPDHDQDVQDVFVSWALQPPPQRKERKPPPVKGERRAPEYAGPRNTEGKKARRKREKEALERAERGEPELEEKSEAAQAEEATGEMEKLSLGEQTAVQPPAGAPSTAAPPLVEEKKEVPEAKEEPPTFLRYYHLFRHGEMASLVARAARELQVDMVDSSPDSIARLEGNAQLVPSTSAGASPHADSEASAPRWRRRVELRSETWERENWCILVAVNWVCQ